ncbi:hypothetical protein TcWFU_005088 [Taenia crassiceps]|uniref:Uncharacterized protein n=1 Tax=Taenia crassiceps TaxID=6207 RepID=A0ABR4QLB7_9CEST
MDPVTFGRTCLKTNNHYLSCAISPRALTKYQSSPVGLSIIGLIENQTNTISKSYGRLYLEYIAVHRDYTNLFRATWVKPVCKAVSNEGEANETEPEKVLFSMHEPPPTMSELPILLDPDRIKVTPMVHPSVDTNTTPVEIHEMGSKEDDELRLEIIRKRLAQNLEGQSIWVKLWPFTYAYKVCLCRYCDYRDCVTDYRRAIEKLNTEYDFLYQQYEILFGAVDMLPPEGNKKIIMLSREQQKEEEEAETQCRQVFIGAERQYGSVTKL